MKAKTKKVLIAVGAGVGILLLLRSRQSQSSGSPTLATSNVGAAIAQMNKLSGYVEAEAGFRRYR